MSLKCQDFQPLYKEIKANSKVKQSTYFVNLITDNFVPGYLGIMVTRQVKFCCIVAVTKDKFDYF